MKTMYNYNRMTKCICAENKSVGKVAVVLFTDFSFENAAEFTLDAVKRTDAETVSKYLKYDEIVAFDGTVYKDSDDYFEESAAYVSVGPAAHEKRKFLILGLPGSCRDWFDSQEKFDEWIDNCPFAVKVIMLK